MTGRGHSGSIDSRGINREGRDSRYVGASTEATSLEHTCDVGDGGGSGSMVGDSSQHVVSGSRARHVPEQPRKETDMRAQPNF
jgi:hypothetical protein